jgi:hypothetical protein
MVGVRRPLRLAVVLGRIPSRDREEINLRGAVLRVAGATCEGQRKDIKAPEKVGPATNQVSFAPAGGRPLRIQVATD